MKRSSDIPLAPLLGWRLYTSFRNVLPGWASNCVCGDFPVEAKGLPIVEVYEDYARISHWHRLVPGVFVNWSTGFGRSPLILYTGPDVSAP